jgi:hypothetical protein
MAIASEVGFSFRLVLNDAAQVSTARREGPELAGAGMNEYDRLFVEPYDLRAPRLNVANLSGCDYLSRNS